MSKQENKLEENALDDSVNPLSQKNPIPGLTQLIPMPELQEYYKQLWNDKQSLQGLNLRLTHLLALNLDLQEERSRLEGAVEEWEHRYDSLLQKLQELEGFDDDGFGDFADVGGVRDGVDGGGAPNGSGMRNAGPNSGKAGGNVGKNGPNGGKGGSNFGNDGPNGGSDGANVGNDGPNGGSDGANFGNDGANGGTGANGGANGAKGGRRSRRNRSKAPGSGALSRLQDQLDQLRNQLQQRDQRLADQAAKNKQAKKDLQNALNDAKRQLTEKEREKQDAINDMKRQLDNKEKEKQDALNDMKLQQNKKDKANQDALNKMKENLDNKEKEMQEKLSDLEDQRDRLNDQVQKAGDFGQDRDAWQKRAEDAEKELGEIREFKTTAEKQNDELVQELRDQLKRAKLSEAKRIEELNATYEIRWKDLSAKFRAQVEGYKSYLENDMKKEYERLMKQAEKEKEALKQRLGNDKDRALKDKIDLNKIKSRLQNMEFQLRRAEQAKEAAEDKIATIEADREERLNNAKYEMDTLSDRYKELQLENAMLRQKIEVHPEVDNFDAIVSEFERSLDMGRPGKKRKRESMVSSVVMRGGNIFRTQRPSDSPIPVKKDGSFVVSAPFFEIDGFANHDNGGPWLKIKNSTNKEQDLQGYALKIESKSLDKPRKHVFDSTQIPAKEHIRVVTKDTKPKLENDRIWSEGWENIDEEMDISLISPEGELVSGPIPLDVPSSKKSSSCAVM